MDKIRSYKDEIEYRIRHLKDKFPVTTIGTVNFGQFNYTLYRIVARCNDSRWPKKDVLLSGISHGDEEAGGFSILHFLDGPVKEYLDRFNFYCYPCLNPSGFETGMRVNMDYVNLNRSFKKPYRPQEIRHVIKSLKQGPKSYYLTVDMHETPPKAIDPKERYLPKDNPSDFYMRETALADSGLRIGDKVIAQLTKDGVPICHWPTIYDDINNNGVIWYPDGCKNKFYATGTSFEGYLYNNYTEHSFTTETPTFWPLYRRVRVNNRVLSLILEYSDIKNQPLG